MAGVFQRLTSSAKAGFTEAVAEAKTRYMTKYNAQNVVVRNLAPSDFTTANTQKSWSFTGVTSTGNTANAVVNITVRDNQYLVVDGVSLASSSAITQIDINTGGKTERFWNVQYAAAGNSDRSIFFTDPIVVDENNNLTVNLYASATGTLTCIFLGAAVEKPGLVVAGRC